MHWLTILQPIHKPLTACFTINLLAMYKALFRLIFRLLKITQSSLNLVMNEYRIAIITTNLPIHQYTYRAFTWRLSGHCWLCFCCCCNKDSKQLEQSLKNCSKTTCVIQSKGDEFSLLVWSLHYIPHLFSFYSQSCSFLTVKTENKTMCVED